METASEENKNQISLSKFSFIALIVFLVILLGLVFFLLYKWQNADSQVTELQTTITTLQQKNTTLEAQLNTLNAGSGGKEEVKAIMAQIDQILQKEKVTLFNEGVNPDEVAAAFANVPSGNKKVVLSTALLLPLRKYRFKLGGHSPSYGFDSPEFARYVLSFAGKDIQNEKNKFLSEIMMEQLEKTDNPQPGDIMFFEGSPGNIALFYLSSGKNGGNGVGIGFLGKNFPGGIYDTSQIGTKFLGYYRVNYGS